MEYASPGSYSYSPLAHNPPLLLLLGFGSFTTLTVLQARSLRGEEATTCQKLQHSHKREGMCDHDQRKTSSKESGIPVWPVEDWIKEDNQQKKVIEEGFATSSNNGVISERKQIFSYISKKDVAVLDTSAHIAAKSVLQSRAQPSMWSTSPATCFSSAIASAYGCFSHVRLLTSKCVYLHQKTKTTLVATNGN